MTTTAQGDPAPPSEQLWRRRMSFRVAVAVLLVAALGLNWSVATLRLHFKKEAVPMRIPFCNENVVPEVIGDWVRVMEDAVDPDIVSELKAYREKGKDRDDYLFCTYIRATSVGRETDELRQEFAAIKLYSERSNKVVEYSRLFPHAVVRLGLSYYTGKADTVAHIPERCFVAGGYEIGTSGAERWSIADPPLDVRVLSFSDKRVNSPLPVCNVAYFFHANGQFLSDPLTVRTSLQNLFARYAYYAKVELRCDNTTREVSTEAMKDLLRHLMPSIEKALPDWSQYQGKK